MFRDSGSAQSWRKSHTWKPEHFISSWESQDSNILQPSDKVESQCQKKKILA